MDLFLLHLFLDSHQFGPVNYIAKIEGLNLGASYLNKISSQPIVNHLPTNLFIGMDDYGYGGNPAVGSGNVYIKGSKNTTDNVEGNVILNYNGTSFGGNTGIGTANPTRRLHIKDDGILIGDEDGSTGDFATLLRSNSSGHPELRFFDIGAIDAKLSINGSRFSMNTGLEVVGLVSSASSASAGLVSSSFGNYTAVPGELSLASNGGTPSFINFTEVGGSFHSVFGVAQTTGDLIYKTNPSTNVTFDGTERFRVVKSTGNFLLGTSVDSGYKLDVNGDANINGLRVGSGTTPANENTFVGLNALTNTTGYYNTALGAYSLQATTTGFQNTATGHGSMRFNTTGYQNTANGVDALKNNTGGTVNTAIGQAALFSNSNGYYNTSVGALSLFQNSTGIQNIAIGNSTLYDVTIGQDNTAIGYNTGRGIITGSGNTILGANVTGLSSTLSNNIIIADGSGNRRINIDSVGNVGIGTLSPISKLDISDSTGKVVNISQTGATNSPAMVIDYSGAGGGNLFSQSIFRINNNSSRNLASFGDVAVIASDGRLFLNSPSSGNFLEVGGSARVLSDFTVTNGNTSLSNTGGGNLLNLTYNGATNAAAINISQTNAGGIGGYPFSLFRMDNRGSNDSVYIHNNGTNPFVITNTGNVGIGTNTPSYKLDVGSASTLGIVASFTNSSGSCTINPTVGIACSSDARLKKNITALQDDYLSKIVSLKPVKYNWNNETTDVDALHNGFIAQDLEQVFPDLVATDANGYKSVFYTNLIPYTIKAIQEINIQMTGLSSIEKPNSFRDSLVAWMGNAGNGINSIFSKKVQTDTLCVGQVCVTEQQFLNMVQANNPTPPSNPEPLIENPPTE
jgi:Chaperone of endosialidase